MIKVGLRVAVQNSLVVKAVMKETKDLDSRPLLCQRQFEVTSLKCTLINYEYSRSKYSPQLLLNLKYHGNVFWDKN